MKTTEKFKLFLSSLYKGALSTGYYIIVLWLMLSSTPLGDAGINVGIGSDFYLHLFMCGAMSMFLCLDWQRKHQWRKMKFWGVLVASALAFVLCGIAEGLQAIPAIPYRYFDPMDLVAEAVGAFLIGILYYFIQSFWSNNERNGRY